MTRRLWLVRHGETTGQSSIRYHGRNDVPLSDVGRAQIRALQPLLAHVEFCRIVHSPQVRAAEAAAILADCCGLAGASRVVDERLREIWFGDCEGLTRAEIDARFPDFWAAYEAGETDAFPGGEPRADYAARVGAVANELAADAWTGDLLVVGHRGTVGQFLRAFVGEPPDDGKSYQVELASLTVLRAEDAAPGRFQLELLGALP
ncbi:MAG: histidine phosphatase family protein [bacterium]|nr:histidine phosphatase family protein [bacterium]